VSPHPSWTGGPATFLLPVISSLKKPVDYYQTAMSEEKIQTATGAETETELRARIAEYEKKMDDIAELISRVRHEINNPLTGVLGQAQLLLREDLSEKARKRAQAIEQLAIRLRDVAAELRQVQRPVKKSEPD
jgi:signal transduction histidine kinase